jgi:geranyl-CoA carboxylase alpha subunit
MMGRTTVGTTTQEETGMAFTKVLVANRGEIACRVITAAKRLGYATVAVYSEADAKARHVSLADEAVCIGPAAASASYLKVDAILDACRQTGADAVHPGYGFLSENAGFAKACADNDITFIGPPVEAIHLMGSKRLSKIAMLEARVPCVPGYQGADQSDAKLLEEAKRIGLPLMIKASAGGGGRGMRVLTDLADLADQLKSARTESKNAFGSDELILERAVVNARHVEIQVFGDSHGNVIHLNERDCSVQRRHQKVIEEAPSPALDADLRARMGEAAVNAAKACDYVGAGTVEFLFTPEKEFYFLEMNTRLQVEHPVTELTTGIDLVAWQLRIAQGEPLPLTQDQVPLHGHAMEVRLYAEDPARNFLPQTGKVIDFQPATGEGVRIDHGLQNNAVISSHYDPMLAKLICYGKDREEARRRLLKTLETTRLLGVSDNRVFLSRLLSHPQFISGEATTDFIKNEFAGDLSLSVQPLPASHWAVAAFCLLQDGAWPEHIGGWHSSIPMAKQLTLSANEETCHLRVAGGADAAQVQIGAQTLAVKRLEHHARELVVAVDGHKQRLAFARQNNTLYVSLGLESLAFVDLTYTPASSTDAASGIIKAPMDGNVLDVRKRQGDKVKKGEVLVIMEAMKMEHSLKADTDGTLTELKVKTGDQVKGKQQLLVITPVEATSPE